MLGWTVSTPHLNSYVEALILLKEKNVSWYLFKEVRWTLCSGGFVVGERDQPKKKQQGQVEIYR